MRWKRLIKCAGGLRCADIVVANEEIIPPGGAVYIEYTCDGCGTHYSWNSATNKRVAINELARGRPAGVEIAPGETKDFHFDLDDRRN